MNDNIKDEIEEEEEDNDDIKVILVGEMGTGKTSLINTAVGLQFQDKVATTTTNTIMNKILNIDNKVYSISLWDTIGQERYRSLTKIFMKGAKIIIFVYDITDIHSFTELNFWFEFTKEIINDDTIVAIVGNKSDLFLNEKVKEEDAKKIAEDNGYEFSLTSAKAPDVFCEFLQNLVEKYIRNKYGDDINDSQRLKKGKHKNKNNKKNCC